jgi:putative sigma-54 modulation protein
MNLTITARRFKIKDDLKSYVEEKTQKLGRFYDGILDVEVVLGWEKLSRYTELRIGVYNKQIVVKEVADEMRKSFDLALDRAERQLKRYKEKMRHPQKSRVVQA